MSHSRIPQRKKTPFKSPPRVAVLVDTSTDWSRRIVSGIISYIKDQNPWQIFIEPRGLSEHLKLQNGWQGDGVIARVTDDKMASHLREQNIPVVNVSSIKLTGPPFPSVTSDMSALAKMAAEYFLGRGFRHFAYFSLQGLEYVSRQREAFLDEVQRAGYEVALFGVKTNPGVQTPDWNLQTEHLAKWLVSLPKPVAILTWNGGREVIHACQLAGITIPEDVALLSASDDLLCEASHISISAVRSASERIGYEAAAMLSQLMRDKEAKVGTKRILPLQVVTRQSTDVLAIRDPALVKALKYIQSNASKPINVGDVAKSSGIHRRLLERRFVDLLQRSPAEHIRRVHLELAKRLLIDTRLPIAEVADQSGFSSAEYMATLFQQELKTTPLRYRRENMMGLK